MKKMLIAVAALAVAAGIAGWLTLNRGPAADQLTWEHTYGGPGRDTATRIVETQDGGSVIAGSRGVVDNASGIERLNAWLLRLDAKGETLWERSWGSGNDEHVGDLRATADGGFIVTGETHSSNSGVGQVWITKLDADGVQRWNHTYQARREGALHAVLALEDGGYVVAGTEQSANPSYYDGWVARVDAQGELLWERFLGGKDDDSLAAVQSTPDGGYLLVGNTQSKGAGRSDAWIVKLDVQGDVQWERTYGGAAPDAALDLVVLGDQGALVAGWSEARGASHGRDGWLLRLDAQGELLWEHFYGGREEDMARALRPTADGGFIVVGTTRSKGQGGQDAWVFRVDKAGKLLWERALGGKDADEAFAVLTQHDGAFLVAGTVSSKGAGRGDAWVFRLNANGQLN